MITIVITNKKGYKEALATINNIKLCEAFHSKKIHIKLYDIGGEVKKHLHDVEVISKGFDKVQKVVNNAVDIVTTPYITFINSGDMYSKSTLDEVCTVLEEKDEIDNINIMAIEEYSSFVEQEEEIDFEYVNLDKNYKYINDNLGCYIFRTDLLRGNQFCSDLKYFWRKKYIAGLLNQEKNLVLIKNVGLVSQEIPMTDYQEFPYAQRESWFVEAVYKYLVPFMKEMKQKGTLSRYIMLNCYNLLVVIFNHNFNLRDKHIFVNNRQEFYQTISELLTMIDDDIIANAGSKIYKVNPPLVLRFFQLKYGKDYEQHYVLDYENASTYLTVNDLILNKINNQKVKIDAINVDENGFILETSVLVYAERDTFQLKASINGKPLEIVENNRFANVSYFGDPVCRWITTQIRIPFTKLKSSHNTFRYSIIMNGHENPFAFMTGRFPARINTSVPGAYTVLGGYMLYIIQAGKGIAIRKYNRKWHIKRELKLWKVISRKSEKMALVRILYWITRPFLRNKKIWITYDKMYKGGDNGEYFYRYMLSQKGKNKIKPYYIINKHYPDAKRMRKQGLKPIYMNSLKHKLYFLNADVIATTHANIPIYSGCTVGGFELMQDLFYGHVVCIQHGLAIQDLPFDLNRVYDNLEGFYCASPNEIENLSKDYYAYEDKDMLRLTGVPRYDGLKSDDKKKILITPTWRRYIAMPASIGNVRPYSPNFKKTDYYKIYNSLINDEKLLQTARETGYEIRYVLHPTLSSQYGDFEQQEGVKVISSLDVNYEKEFVESSLMVTDYSGVQFDFAYMRKPILYYHPEKLPPHYEEGGLDYERQGFGEICKEHDVLVDRLCEYMRLNCRMTEKYKQRVDDFFAYSDHNNCKRIYDDLVKRYY